MRALGSGKIRVRSAPTRHKSTVLKVENIITLRMPEYIRSCKTLYNLLTAIFEYTQAAFLPPLLDEADKNFAATCSGSTTDDNINNVY